MDVKTAVASLKTLKSLYDNIGEQINCHGQTGEIFIDIANLIELQQQQLSELKQHLKEIEWTPCGGFSICPACLEELQNGHTDSCWLAQAIKE